MRPYQGIHKINKIFEKLLQASFKKHGFINAKIVTDWHYIIGKHLAELSLPQKIIFPANQAQSGVLYIATSNPGLSLEIQAQESFIISKISTYFGYQAISRIKVIIDKNIHKKPKDNRRNIRVNISKKDEKEIKAALSQIKDKDLHDQLASLASNIFQS